MSVENRLISVVSPQTFFFCFVLFAIGVDPFTHVTIAAACMKALRHKFLSRDQIAYFPQHVGTKARDEVRWLEYLKWRHPHLPIQLCAQYGGFSVTGVDSPHRRIYKFLDCFVDGCLECFPGTGKKLAKTKARLAMMQSHGYFVTQIWSHQLYNLIHDPKSRYKEFTALFPTTWSQPISVRDAFYGGRTNASCLYYKCDPDERIRYVDFTSLYPYINKYGVYPVGHPDIITTTVTLDRLNLRLYFGIVKCRVVPPRKLFHPVLPVRYGGKLMFPLCRTCMQDQSRDCPHNDDDRSFLGSWCTPELYKAMDMGYVVTAIQQVHHFSNKRQGLFGDYVNTFLKVKQEKSGWPDDPMSDEAKAAYIAQYLRNEKIALDPNAIEKNPGMRQTTKLMLNSLWGKFGQRGGRTQSQNCTISKDFYKIVFNDRFEVTGMFRCPTNPKSLELLYEEKEYTSKEPNNTNVYVACFTTCLARLRLYGILERLGTRVLYYDTDSIVYVQDMEDLGEYQPQLGDYLGDLTDELGDDGSRWITEFVATGPKSYSYRDNGNRVTCKFKGITKTLHNLGIVNFKSMVTCVAGGHEHELHGSQNLVFSRNRHGQVKTGIVKKIFRMVYDKRYYNPPSYQTFPFGY